MKYIRLMGTRYRLTITILLAALLGGGSVYGGGEQSTINGTGTLGNAIVTLKGNVIVEGDVFGGGDNGVVGGSTEVNIEE